MIRLCRLFSLAAIFALSMHGDALAQPPDRHIEQRVEVLVARLSLTPDQAVAVRRILVSAQAALEAARESDATPGPLAHDVRQRILWDAEDRIWALLTCAQKDAFRLLERERRAEMLERARPGHGHGRGHGHGHRPRRRMR